MRKMSDNNELPFPEGLRTPHSQSHSRRRATKVVMRSIGQSVHPVVVVVVVRNDRRDDDDDDEPLPNVMPLASALIRCRDVRFVEEDSVRCPSVVK